MAKGGSLRDARLAGDDQSRCRRGAAVHATALSSRSRRNGAVVTHATLFLALPTVTYDYTCVTHVTCVTQATLFLASMQLGCSYAHSPLFKMNAHSRTHGIDHNQAEAFFGLGAGCRVQHKMRADDSVLCRPGGPFFGGDRRSLSNSARVAVYVWQCMCGSARVAVHVWQCMCGSACLAVHVWQCARSELQHVARRLACSPACPQRQRAPRCHAVAAAHRSRLAPVAHSQRPPSSAVHPRYTPVAHP